MHILILIERLDVIQYWLTKKKPDDRKLGEERLRNLISKLKAEANGRSSFYE